MKYDISKELFEAVMGFKIAMNLIIELDNTVIGYLVYGQQDTPEQVHNNHRRIYINDFFFKCKEWALKQEYNIWSDCIGNITIQDENFDTVDASISNKSEQQAVFDACQWILENKDNR